MNFIKLKSIDDIKEEDIILNSIIIFDWDNTLKIYNKETKNIRCDLNIERLKLWIEIKKCKIFIVSALRPSLLNLETILIEINKLKLKEFFVKDNDIKEINTINGYKYARYGNIIICDYDKSEIIKNLYDFTLCNILFFDDEIINLYNYQLNFSNFNCRIYHINR